MQESESNRNVAMAVLIIVLLMIFPVYYPLYYRHRLSYHFWTDKIGQTEELLKKDRYGRVVVHKEYGGVMAKRK